MEHYINDKPNNGQEEQVMRKNWEAQYGIGLCLTENEYDEFADAYAHAMNLSYNRMINEIDNISIDDYRFQYADGSRDFFYLDVVSPKDCDGFQFTPFVNKLCKIRWNKGTDKGTYYIAFTKQNPFHMDTMFQCPYKSYKDILDEFYAKFGGYLPEDFSWHTHIGKVSYAEFC